MKRCLNDKLRWVAPSGGVLLCLLGFGFMIPGHTVLLVILYWGVKDLKFSRTREFLSKVKLKGQFGSALTDTVDSLITILYSTADCAHWQLRAWRWHDRMKGCMLTPPFPLMSRARGVAACKKVSRCIGYGIIKA
jgi:hypothetical protein